MMKFYKNRNIRFLLAVFLAFSLTSCSKPPGKKDERVTLLQNLWDCQLGPKLTVLKEKTKVLEDKSTAYCNVIANSSATQPELDDARKAAQDAWKDAYIAVKEQSAFIVGPYYKLPVKKPRRRQMDYWPTGSELNNQDVVKLGLGGGELTVNGQKGLYPIEYLLFSKVGDSTYIDPHSPKYCTYLKKLAKDLKETSDSLYNAWDPKQWKDGQVKADLRAKNEETYKGWFYNLTHPGNYVGITDFRSALAEPLNGTWHMLQNLYKDYLDQVFIDGHKNDRREAEKSMYSVDGIKAYIDSVKGVYYGNTLDADKYGLPSQCKSDNRNFVSYSYEVEGYNPDLANAIKKQFKLIEDDLKGMKQEDMTKDNSKLKKLKDDISKLLTLINADVMNTLGLQKTGNDSDND